MTALSPGVLSALAALPGLFFVFAFGACVGSFVNVLVYRLPRGLGVVTPASRCPACETKLTWRENIPIFGWVFLGGRCRFCKSRISPQYPLIELTTAALFALLYTQWFVDPLLLHSIGLDVSSLRPTWALPGVRWMWPALLINLSLVAGLIAMTLIDAATFTIPLILPWIVTGIAITVHPLHALFVQLRAGSLDVITPAAGSTRWVIPTAHWDWTIAALAGAVGLAVAIILLEVRALPRSFADYEAWEREALARRDKKNAPADQASHAPRDDAPPSDPKNHAGAMLRALVVSAPALAGMFLGFSIGVPMGKAPVAAAIGTALGLLVGLVLRRLVPGPEDAQDDPIWVQYPHARQEVLKEAVFLAAPTVAAAGAYLIVHTSSWAAGDPPLWLAALSGSLTGFLVGGGVVWVVRILGTLAFGKEAMGLGDVHLLAAVGACLGWIDPLLAFFIAPFFGIAWALGSLVTSSIFRRQGAALPYGPHLAFATLLLVYGRPIFAWGLSMISGVEVHLP